MSTHEVRTAVLNEVAEFLRHRLSFEDPQEYENFDAFEPLVGERLIEGSGADHADVLYRLLTWLRKQGVEPVSDPVHRFLVKWVLRSSMDDSIVAGWGEKVIIASDQRSAVEQVVEWVHENHPKADPRIDPFVQGEAEDLGPVGEALVNG